MNQEPVAVLGIGAMGYGMAGIAIMVTDADAVLSVALGQGVLDDESGAQLEPTSDTGNMAAIDSGG